MHLELVAPSCAKEPGSEHDPHSAAHQHGLHLLLEALHPLAPTLAPARPDGSEACSEESFRADGLVDAADAVPVGDRRGDANPTRVDTCQSFSVGSDALGGVLALIRFRHRPAEYGLQARELTCMGLGDASTLHSGVAPCDGRIVLTRDSSERLQSLGVGAGGVGLRGVTVVGGEIGVRVPAGASATVTRCRACVVAPQCVAICVSMSTSFLFVV